ncbi:hypothetical protein F5Y01DRAFT_319417 [Xylaria sp. FL0043]|nr:hypothetical protein F5Y01DRAFT_319417 [Xylaria sp. FL0043]
MLLDIRRRGAPPLTPQWPGRLPRPDLQLHLNYRNARMLLDADASRISQQEASESAVTMTVFITLITVLLIRGYLFWFSHKPLVVLSRTESAPGPRSLHRGSITPSQMHFEGMRDSAAGMLAV